MKKDIKNLYSRLRCLKIEINGKGEFKWTTTKTNLLPHVANINHLGSRL